MLKAEPVCNLRKLPVQAQILRRRLWSALRVFPQLCGHSGLVVATRPRMQSQVVNDSYRIIAKYLSLHRYIYTYMRTYIPMCTYVYIYIYIYVIYMTLWINRCTLSADASADNFPSTSCAATSSSKSIRLRKKSEAAAQQKLIIQVLRTSWD